MWTILNAVIIISVIIAVITCALAFHYHAHRVSWRKTGFRGRALKVCIVLGSGGHTTELLRLVSAVGARFSQRVYVLADSDAFSASKVPSTALADPGDPRQCKSSRISETLKARSRPGRSRAVAGSGRATSPRSCPRSTRPSTVSPCSWPNGEASFPDIPLQPGRGPLQRARHVHSPVPAGLPPLPFLSPALPGDLH